MAGARCGVCFCRQDRPEADGNRARLDTSSFAVGGHDASPALLVQLVVAVLFEYGDQGGGDVASDARSILHPKGFEGDGSRQRWWQPLVTIEIGTFSGSVPRLRTRMAIFSTS